MSKTCDITANICYNDSIARKLHVSIHSDIWFSSSSLVAVPVVITDDRFHESWWDFHFPKFIKGDPSSWFHALAFSCSLRQTYNNIQKWHYTGSSSSSSSSSSRTTTISNVYTALFAQGCKFYTDTASRTLCWPRHSWTAEFVPGECMWTRPADTQGNKCPPCAAFHCTGLDARRTPRWN